MSTRTVSITDPDLDLVVEALKAEASRRQRAAMRAAGELEADVTSGEVSDRRPAAVRITKVLAEAAALVTFAERLEAAPVITDADPAPPPAPDDDELEAATAELLTTADDEASEALVASARSVLDEDEPVDAQEVLSS